MKYKLFLLSLLLMNATSAMGTELPMCEGEVLPIHKVAPQYPTGQIRSRGIEAFVTFEFTLDDEDVPKNIKILDSTSIVFERSSLKSLKQWKFPPQSKHCLAKTKIVFKLEG